MELEGRRVQPQDLFEDSVEILELVVQLIEVGVTSGELVPQPVLHVLVTSKLVQGPLQPLSDRIGV
jgi:hypothetical protein